MRTFQKVKGAPVFYEKTHRLLGEISDIVLSEREESVKGYWIHNRQWWSKKHYLSLKSIAYEDINGFYVTEKTVLQTMSKYDRRLFEGKRHIFGRPVIDKDGITLGLIEDVCFLPDLGKIVGYELTEGLFSDLRKGIRILKPKSPLVNRGNSFIVLET
ncbi:PRC-barrel domain-containing protein [Evansella cellulosilytica]|uniref:PRC-barrel domain protein n=1 Tax=Evansella cellulosilytica (strain ATCC 21833 / DSM 2522 / FERM P-1141 / JCM 9156 / N-4) TaxID=649639 RepID=E6TVA0_EVAC2|nr:PRC-barrel domain-containing protein [Evansella cellulosilytica]ADU29784.1 PRC-barrel domain protein [Evansella cellulosilytica DSM 2522]